MLDVDSTIELLRAAKTTAAITTLLKRQHVRLTQRATRELRALLAEYTSMAAVEGEHAELLAAAAKARALARTMAGNEAGRKLDTFATDIESTVAKEIAALKKTGEARLAKIRTLLSRGGS